MAPPLPRPITAGTGAAPAAVPCVPVARLAVATVWVDGDELEVATVRLDFDYGGLLVRAGTRAAATPRVRRDGAAEVSARRILEGLGAIDLSCLDDCETDGAVDYAVRLDRDVHALCAFSAYALPQLRTLGWRVEVAADYPWQTVSEDVPLTATVAGDEQRPDWFSVELGVDVDGHRVDLLPALLAILDATSSLEQLARTPRKCIAVPVGDKRYLPVPPERLRLLLAVLREMYRERDGKLGAHLTRATALAELGAALHDTGRPVRWTGATEVRDLGYDLALGPRTDAPVAAAGLAATLRGYQEDGVRWLQHLRACATGGILADDMGLGKTLQTIAHVLLEKEAGRLDRPILIVTLTSLVGNWQREFGKFAPSLKVVPLHGAHRAERLAEIASHDVAITTYPLVWRDKDALAAHRFHTVVLDEAHAVKNPDGLAHEAIRALGADNRLALSGTPIENHLGELWALFDLVNPGMLGTADEFKASFRIPIEQHGETRRLDALRSRVRPYLLRRTKESVAKELPPKTEIVRAVDLSGAQRELYEGLRMAAHADVRAQIRERGIGGSQIAILDALLKLRQVCCDPRLVGVEAAKKVTDSAKYTMLLELITQQLGAGRRILVFSQFARMLALISEGLLGLGVGHVTLTGATADRQKPIDAFERGRADVFLISLKAGGAGLNLTSADTVIHYDPWWNPAVQAQATDRAYRIGQQKPVFAFSLIAAGSVEDRMLGLQKRKRQLADSIIADGADALPGLSAGDIDDLLAPLG
ncbi:MAG: DEAD/DEAH box helicase [Kofleriaceae bacterium]|jgi:superfamily II DNA or RNA helicase|nr:DEAD/DEAH box helicase [Kofleriaceae bacterium]MBP9169247.1 DEAD/DEAH box helicase [Kofleriaceae bacterium]MBP9859152.1 DEAD/DEAH box helicase [Kofleriaceae bacterium]